MITVCSLVELRRPAGAGAGPTTASEELDIDETLLGQSVQVIGRGLARNPEGVGGLVPPDGRFSTSRRRRRAGGGSGRSVSRWRRVGIEMVFVHEVTLKRDLVDTRFSRCKNGFDHS